MSREDLALRSAADRVVAHHTQVGRSAFDELVRSRTLSSVMEALNQQLIDGTPAEKERARLAIEKLGFATE